MRRGLDELERQLRAQDYGAVYVVMDDDVLPHLKKIADQRYDAAAAKQAARLSYRTRDFAGTARLTDDFMARQAISALLRVRRPDLANAFAYHR